MPPCSPIQATQASGRISVDGPASTATQRTRRVAAATSADAARPVEASSSTAARAALRAALRERDPAVSPVETLRRLAHRVVAEQRPYVEFSPVSRRYVEAVAASESLKARARAIRDEVAQEAAAALAGSVGRGADDPAAQWAAGLLLAGWTVAFLQAHRSFAAQRDAAQARAVFLAFVDKGALGLQAALAGTPYA